MDTQLTIEKSQDITEKKVLNELFNLMLLNMFHSGYTRPCELFSFSKYNRSSVIHILVPHVGKYC